jgi:6,7-dimethyl-8-ribityllumazine synthase
MPKIHEGTFDASGLRFAVVVSRFNTFITEKLLDGAVDAVVRHGGRDEDLEVFKVPGTWELPQIAQAVAQTRRFDGIIALGCLIRGGTSHYDLLAAEVAKGLAHVASGTGVPVAFGVLTCDTLEQAIERAGTKAGNKGFDSAVACIELVRVMQSVAAPGPAARVQR